MINAINVEYIGEDDWGRKCYRNVRVPDRIYKDVDGVLHTAILYWLKANARTRIVWLITPQVILN